MRHQCLRLSRGTRSLPCCRDGESTLCGCKLLLALKLGTYRVCINPQQQHQVVLQSWRPPALHPIFSEVLEYHPRHAKNLRHAAIKSSNPIFAYFH